MGKKKSEPSAPPRKESYEEEDERIRSEFPKTPPVDPRFPNVNVTNWCFQMFNDYHRCRQLLPKTPERCEQFKEVYTKICPNAWVARWEEQLQAGTYPGRLPNTCPPPAP